MFWKIFCHTKHTLLKPVSTLCIKIFNTGIQEYFLPHQMHPLSLLGSHCIKVLNTGIQKYFLPYQTHPLILWDTHCVEVSNTANLRYSTHENWQMMTYSKLIKLTRLFQKGWKKGYVLPLRYHQAPHSLYNQISPIVSQARLLFHEWDPHHSARNNL